VTEGESFGVELKAWGRSLRSVKRIAEDWVSEREAVDAELVAAAGDGRQRQARGGGFAAEDGEVGHRMPAPVEADHLPRPVGPVADQRQRDPPARRRDPTLDEGDVALADLPPLELPVEVPLREPRSGEHHCAGGVAVEPVNEKRLREHGPNASLHAILQARRLGRNAQKSRWLLHNEDGIIGVQEAKAAGLIQVKAWAGAAS
jgi:hypothetical protein